MKVKLDPSLVDAWNCLGILRLHSTSTFRWKFLEERWFGRCKKLFFRGYRSMEGKNSVFDWFIQQLFHPQGSNNNEDNLHLKKSLRSLSIVLRQLKTPGNHQNVDLATNNGMTFVDGVTDGASITESVKRAKEAVALDINDGTSWCKSLQLNNLLTFTKIY